MPKTYFHPKKPRVSKPRVRVGKKQPKGVAKIGTHKSRRSGMGRHAMRGGY